MDHKNDHSYYHQHFLYFLYFFIIVIIITITIIDNPLEVDLSWTPCEAEKRSRRAHQERVISTASKSDHHHRGFQV